MTPVACFSLVLVWRPSKCFGIGQDFECCCVFCFCCCFLNTIFSKTKWTYNVFASGQFYGLITTDKNLVESQFLRVKTCRSFTYRLRALPILLFSGFRLARLLPFETKSWDERQCSSSDFGHWAGPHCLSGRDRPLNCRCLGETQAPAYLLLSLPLCSLSLERLHSAALKQSVFSIP